MTGAIFARFPFVTNLAVIAAVAGSLLFLSACAPERIQISPEGRLVVLGGDAPFSAEGLSDDWHIEGPSIGRLTDTARPVLHFSSDDAGHGVLAVNHALKGFILARRTYALVLASPFLTWRWRLDGAFGQEHPLSVVVGFLGGDSTARKGISLPFGMDERGFPQYDRILVLSWGGISARAGSIETDERGARVTVRAGMPRRQSWVDEAIDLGAIYARAWPDDAVSKAKIAFIGVASAGDPSGAQGRIANIILSR
ncbi:MAG: DUF3047 domain-containing protein [Rhodospirillales bacterium]|nr:DUF3047 domain-containing protein [Rhodospirillales bacterium]